jgi:hypothetical protein
LRDQPELQQKLVRLAASRESRYAEAGVQLDTTGRSIEAVAAEVAELAAAAGIGSAAADA